MEFQHREKSMNYIKLKQFKGFTLIEILVVVALLSTVGLITAVILYSSLRGGEKTKLILSAKENGNYAVSIFSREARYANYFYGLSPDGATSSYSVDACSSAVSYPYAKIVNSANEELVFACVGNGITLTRDGKTENLINTTQVGVVPSSCGFTCKSATTVGSYTLGLSFQLIDRFSVTPSASVENVVFEKRLVSPIRFETSVTLRNTGN